MHDYIYKERYRIYKNVHVDIYAYFFKIPGGTLEFKGPSWP
jgi:hypothetical protein